MGKPTVTELNAFLSKVRPQGILKFPRLTNAFDGHKFSDGKFTAQINLPKGDAEVESFVAQVNGYQKAIGGAEAVIKDGDSLNRKGVKPAPGHYVVNLKAGAQSKVGYYDAGKNRISPEEFEDGDTVRVKVNAFDYTQSLGRPGVSLWMNGFQLIAKTEADFDAVEGGYVAPVAPVVAPAANEDDFSSAPLTSVYPEGQDATTILRSIRERSAAQG
jgi:hypothetical protein